MTRETKPSSPRKRPARSPSKKPERPPNKLYFERLLLDRDVSQRKLAKYMDLDQSSLVRAFQGKRQFQIHEVVQMTHILRVPLEDILRNLHIGLPLMQSHKGCDELRRENAQLRARLERCRKLGSMLERAVLAEEEEEVNR